MQAEDIIKTRKMHQKSWLFITMVSCVCLCLSNVNFASSDNANLGVSANIIAKCKFVSGGPSGTTVSFGDYDPITTNETVADQATGGVDAKCTKNTISQIAMGTGLYAANASGTSRAMSDGQGNYLSYEIYSDAGRATVWNSSSTVSYTDNGGSYTTLPIYASIPPGQDAAAGSYSDTVTMTISY